MSGRDVRVEDEAVLDGRACIAYARNAAEIIVAVDVGVDDLAVLDLAILQPARNAADNSVAIADGVDDLTVLDVARTLITPRVLARNAAEILVAAVDNGVDDPTVLNVARVKARNAADIFVAVDDGVGKGDVLHDATFSNLVEKS